MSTKELFYKFITDMLTSVEIEENSDYIQIMEKIEMDNFLLKQVSKDNGSVPYQVHEQELIKILDKQGKHYPLLKENKDKIISTFRFRIPYYVGPLNNESGRYWIKRESGKITPWNFEEKVDRLESAQGFIRNLTNSCSYLLDQPVVPKKSLLYTRFEVLNELNNIRVDGKKIDTVQKSNIIKEIFMKKKKVKAKDIEQYFKAHTLCDKDIDLEITGMAKAGEFSSNLESWIDFTKIYGDRFDDSYHEIELIIEWISVYEDKRILKERIKKELPNITDELLKQIVKKNYSGWGRLSRKLLEELRVNDQFNERRSIMDVLDEKNLNFQQIVTNSKLGFKELIAKEADVFSSEKISYNDIQKLQGSPALKRGIWQSMLIVKELTKVMKHDPTNIFIEFARSDEEKARTQSKVSKLLEIYKTIWEEEGENTHLKELIKMLNAYPKNDKLLNERLYLYYTQNGKCMYSGEPLDIGDLSNYEIDHIVPQSYIKDDSIENKVLVKRIENQYKGDRLFISESLRDRRLSFWKRLHKYNLIGAKKFKNLTNCNPTAREELGFINRQLVETRQITKHVANLLTHQYKDTNIVSIKATLSHDFRDKYNLYKLRELNDYHHAHDAYIASIIGLYVLRKFPVLRTEFLFNRYNQIEQYVKKKTNDEGKKLNKNKFGFIINQLGITEQVNKETNEVVWGGQETLVKVLKAFRYKDCYITKKTEEKKGQLFNLTLLKTAKNTVISNHPHKVIPVNKGRSDITKYGGYTSLEKAFGIAVEYTKKKKLYREVIDMPIAIAQRGKGEQLEYIRAEVGSNNVKIIKDKILYNQLIEVDGCLFFMASASEWNNAKQLTLSSQSAETLFNLFNEKNYECEGTQKDLLDLYDEFVNKLETEYKKCSSVAKKLNNAKEEYKELSDKKAFWKQTLLITKTGGGRANLKKMIKGFSESEGRFAHQKIDLNKVTFIQQSVTGIYSKKVIL